MRCRPGVVVFLWSILVLPSLSHAATYTDVWAVEIDGGEEEARAIATRNGFVYVDQVRWLEQQVVISRARRDLYFNDPGWENWVSNGNEEVDHYGVTIEKVWKMGVTGKGVVVSILDDGLEHNHTELIKNYDPEASWDVNGGDPDPFPRYSWNNENRHGTQMAGILAGEANNSMCGLGIAFNARVGGVRMLDGRVTDKVEAEALSLNPQYIDIYICSWGPSDDGAVLATPGTLGRSALVNGITKGRSGLGSIYVWALMNTDTAFPDNLGCDGYASSIYTIAISLLYSDVQTVASTKPCTAVLAANSVTNFIHKTMMPTSLHNSCAGNETSGSSYIAPLAAGMCALALEVNPSLTWRDMQHIIVVTANATSINSDWDEHFVKNGIGKPVSPVYGFGAMDASAMVSLARHWKTVPEQRRCLIKADGTTQVVPVGSSITLELETNGCNGTKDHVIFLEHVQVQVQLALTTARRGDVEILLTSAMGTRSPLWNKESGDLTNEFLKDWTFMTTHNWGEFANGTWSLNIATLYGPSVELGEWTLILYGTNQKPKYRI